MVKTNNTKFSAASVAKGSVVLSRTVEKNFALEAEVSRLRHHISVLSKRLHTTTREKEILESILRQFGEKAKGEPSGDVVAEEVEITDATEEVADDREEVRPTCEEVAEEKSVAEIEDEADEDEPQVAVPGMEVACEYNRYAQDLVPYDQKESIQVPMEVDDIVEERKATTKKIVELEKEGRELIKIVPSSLSDMDKAEEMVRLFEEEVEELKKRASKKIEVKGKEELTNLNKSEDEDVVMGGIIVAGGALKKARKKKNKKKWKSNTAGNKENEVEEKERIEGTDKEGVKRKWTVEEWKSYGNSMGYDVEVESDYGPWV